MEMAKVFVKENETLNTERPSFVTAPWPTYCLDDDMAPGGTNMSCDHFPVMSRSIDVKTSSKHATSTYSGSAMSSTFKSVVESDMSAMKTLQEFSLVR